MRFTVLLTVLVMSAASAGAGDLRLGVTVGDNGAQGRLGLGVRQPRDDDRLRQHPGADRDRDARPGKDRARDRRRRDHRHDLPPYVVIERETAPPPAPPERAAPAKVPAAEVPAATPPDPGGSIGRYRARGHAGPRPWTLGAVLPSSLPHVKLAPAAYGLPDPPPGQIYARIRGDVLLIDETTRRVMAVVPE